MASANSSRLEQKQRELYGSAAEGGGSGSVRVRAGVGVSVRVSVRRASLAR